MTVHLRIERSIPDETILDRASETLRNGGLVAFPTDTVYGLGVNVLCPESVEKIYEVKQRPKSKPLPILLASPKQLETFMTQKNQIIDKLVHTFWPGPLTLVVTCDKEPFAGQKIGFRVPDDPIAVSIIEKSKSPIACPSANLSGQPSPKTAQEVLRDLDGKIDLVIDAGPTQIGRESTVVEINHNEIKFLRHGYISKELIDTCLNRPTLDKGKIKKVLFVCTGNSCRSVIAEGLFNHLIREKKPIHAISAGTTAFPGIRPSENAVIVMRDEGIDISNHLSQSLTPELIEKADLVIAMTKAHQRFILEIAKNPEVDSKKVHLLMAFSSRWDFFGVDVEDPIGQALWAYRNCLEMMRDPIQRLIESV
jgi:tRNA threonylcarbamoyl adenosine modification protein (Sua5/YciO/YrdC/YwlC family)